MKYKIILESYDQIELDDFLQSFICKVKEDGSIINGPLPLPIIIEHLYINGDYSGIKPIHKRYLQIDKFNKDYIYNRYKIPMSIDIVCKKIETKKVIKII